MSTQIWPAPGWACAVAMLCIAGTGSDALAQATGEDVEVAPTGPTGSRTVTKGAPNEVDQKDPPCRVCPGGAPCEVHPKAQPNEATLVVDAELGVGATAQAVGTRSNAGAMEGALQSMSAPTLVSAGVEWLMGRRLWLGGGLTRFEISDPFGAAEQRSLTGAEIRARAHLQVSRTWGVDLIARVGLNHWSDVGEGSEVGWSTRLAVGAEYVLTEGFLLTVSIGRARFDRFDLNVDATAKSDATGTAEPADGGATTAFKTAAMATWLFTFGVRVF